MYKKREALTGKSEAYKKVVRSYLEILGFSQIIDSFIDATKEDMIFYNPYIAPGKKFVVEIKAEKLSLFSKKFAEDFFDYFNKWLFSEENINFILFVQEVNKPNEWDSFFNNKDNLIETWCNWFNEKLENKIKKKDYRKFKKFVESSEINVVNIMDLSITIDEKKNIASTSITNLAKNLYDLAYRRKQPVMRKSTILMNLLPFFLPEKYYMANCTAENKEKIYSELKNINIPPFIWKKEKKILTFSNLKNTPLVDFIEGEIESNNTSELQIINPSLSSRLVHIHLRRIMWNKGIWRDKDFFYFPFISKAEGELHRQVTGENKPFTVVTKYLHTKDSDYGIKGQINFYFHQALEIATPTYWGKSFLEVIPRRYYTRDGQTPIDSKERKKIDLIFRKPDFDRSSNRIRLMKFWKHYLKSNIYEIQKEDWFDHFHLGDFLMMPVSWSPEVIGRQQTTLWDYGKAHV